MDPLGTLIAKRKKDRYVHHELCFDQQSRCRDVTRTDVLPPHQCQNSENVTILVGTGDAIIPDLTGAAYMLTSVLVCH